jgi:3'-phosphoadenosine 5'-phosphosulfate sulfotransferase (PAPS reductase)/FAD synthetase
VGFLFLWRFMAQLSAVFGSELADTAPQGTGILEPAPRRLNHLRAPEAESIHILREAVAEFARPVMLYSIGKDLKKLELHRLPTGRNLWKASLLADWNWEQVWQYADANGIPYLPQYDEGYLSIGCQPCTALPSDPNNPRSGRCGGTKLECGIHAFSTQVGK